MSKRKPYSDFENLGAKLREAKKVLIPFILRTSLVSVLLIVWIVIVENAVIITNNSPIIRHLSIAISLVVGWNLNKWSDLLINTILPSRKNTTNS